MLRSAILYLINQYEVSSELLYLILGQSYHDSAISRALNLLHKNNYIETSNDKLIITTKGQVLLESQIRLLDVQRENWDGLWVIVSFNIPEKRRFLRDKFRRILFLDGYRLWNGSFWISPWRNGLVDEFIMQNPDLEIEMFKAIRLNTRISESEMVSRIYSIDKYQTAYQAIIKLWNDSFEGGAEITIQKKVAKKLIIRYLQTVIDDPGLPKKLLPSNYGFDECSKLVWEWFHFLSL